MGDRRRSDTVVVSTINYADQGLEIDGVFFVHSGFRVKLGAMLSVEGIPIIEMSSASDLAIGMPFEIEDK